MNTLLVLAALGQWTYAGFHSDPPKSKPIVPVVKPAPKPTNNLLRSPDCNCPPYNCQCDIPCRCAKPATAKPVEPPKARTEPYRRKDVSGQSWRYPPEGSTREVVPADLEILDAFVRGRNSVLQPSINSPPPAPLYYATPQVAPQTPATPPTTFYAPPMIGAAACRT